MKTQTKEETHLTERECIAAMGDAITALHQAYEDLDIHIKSRKRSAESTGTMELYHMTREQIDVAIHGAILGDNALRILLLRPPSERGDPAKATAAIAHLLATLDGRVATKKKKRWSSSPGRTPMFS